MYVFSNAQGQCEYYQWSGKAYWHISGLAKHSGSHPTSLCKWPITRAPAGGHPKYWPVTLNYMYNCDQACPSIFQASDRAWLRFLYWNLFRSDEGLTLETSDYTIRIGSTPTFFIFRFV